MNIKTALTQEQVAYLAALKIELGESVKIELSESMGFMIKSPKTPIIGRDRPKDSKSLILCLQLSHQAHFGHLQATKAHPVVPG
jgi:hypothetical protein